jgi:cell division protein FtsA
MRGEVLNIRQVVESIQTTMNEVRQQVDFPIQEVFVGIAGQHIRCLDNRAGGMRQNDDEISDEEINEMEKQMYKTCVEPGEKILHVIPQSYEVDKSLGINNPVGMVGQRLEANYRIFVGKEKSAEYTKRCIRQAGFSLKQLILEPLASAKAVLSEDEKEVGVAMVDIGGGTTDMVIYYDNIVRHSAVIPFGGNVITDDIRHGCGVLQRQANDMKEQYGSCFSDLVDETTLVIQGVNGRESREVSFKFLADIIEARMEEIMEAVTFEIERSGYADKLPAGIVFTGGGAMIQHLAEFVRNKTGMEARVAKPINVTDDSPKDVKRCSYATAVGLLLKGFEYEEIALKPQMPLEPVIVETSPEPVLSVKRKRTKGPKPGGTEPQSSVPKQGRLWKILDDIFQPDNSI